MSVIDLFFVILTFSVSVLFTFMTLSFVMKVSLSVHRRAREILYMQDHGLKGNYESGVLEIVAFWQAARERKDREASLPSVGDLIVMNPMYTHMFGLESKQPYLVLGLSSVKGSSYPSFLDLQCSDGSFEKIKISDWDSTRYSITKAARSRT
jgi:hypothetical protein